MRKKCKPRKYCVQRREFATPNVKNRRSAKKKKLKNTKRNFSFSQCSFSLLCFCGFFLFKENFTRKMDTYESVLLIKPEVFIYKIPPSGNNRRHRYLQHRIFIVKLLQRYCICVTQYPQCSLVNTTMNVATISICCACFVGGFCISFH